MLQRIIKLYGVPTLINATVPWYDEQGQNNCVCHKENERHHAAVIDDYTETIRENGAVQCARGAPFAIMNTTAIGRPYLLITFGSLSRGVYNAAIKYPDALNATATLDAGMANLTVFQALTPPDVYRFG